MSRKLFCELSPLTYRIAILKNQWIRGLMNFVRGIPFAKQKSEAVLPIVIYKHNSLIRRKLGNVDSLLQDNKAINLSLAAPKVTHILIRPGEVFSFWKLVGNPSKRKGYKEGLTISRNKTDKGIGGGMCQFTNLIHWLVLHSPMEIIEHHHHDQVDLFPDYNRQVPFGTGTSIMYNYLDYRFKNTTDLTFQLITYTTDTYLCAELRANQALSCTYHIKAEHENFVEEDDGIYRIGEVYRECVDKQTGNLIFRTCIRNNHVKVMYEMNVDVNQERHATSS